MTPDPNLYERMSQPYENESAAQGAIKSFLREVAVLREKHRIAEVAMIAAVYTAGDPGECLAMTQTLGDQDRMPKMASALTQQTLKDAAERHERAAAELRRAAEGE